MFINAKKTNGNYILINPQYIKYLERIITGGGYSYLAKVDNLTVVIDNETFEKCLRKEISIIEEKEGK